MTPQLNTQYTRDYPPKQSHVEVRVPGKPPIAINPPAVKNMVPWTTQLYFRVIATGRLRNRSFLCGFPPKLSHSYQAIIPRSIPCNHARLRGCFFHSLVGPNDFHCRKPVRPSFFCSFTVSSPLAEVIIPCIKVSSSSTFCTQTQAGVHFPACPFTVSPPSDLTIHRKEVVQILLVQRISPSLTAHWTMTPLITPNIPPNAPS